MKQPTTAHRLNDAKETAEAIRVILELKRNKGEQDSQTYKIYEQKHEQACRIIEKLRQEVGRQETIFAESILNHLFNTKNN